MRSFTFLLVVLIVFVSCDPGEQPSGAHQLTGPYLGQKVPGAEPRIFAPGIVNRGLYTRDIAITPDGREIYFGMAAPGFLAYSIFYTKLESGVWTEPRVVPHMEDPDVFNLEPFITPGGEKMLFLSNRADSARRQPRGDQDIWIMDREGDSWGTPYNPGPPVNTDEGEFFPSMTREGRLYFTRDIAATGKSMIYRSELKDGVFTEPEELPAQVNCGTNRYNAWVDPEERFLIVAASGRDDSYGSTDYYVVFHNKQDEWSEPVNLGPKINSRYRGDHSASLSPDGKYLFFMSGRPVALEAMEEMSYSGMIQAHNKPGNGNPAIWWVKADFIQLLNPW